MFLLSVSCFLGSSSSHSPFHGKNLSLKENKSTRGPSLDTVSKEERSWMLAIITTLSPDGET